MAKSFYFHNHQNKSDRLINALLSHGWKQQPGPNRADVIFTDVDIAAHSKDLEHAHARGKKIMMVPHAAMPNLFGDFPGDEPYKNTAAQFVPASGHVDVMRAWGYTRPLEVMGWHLCETRPFQSRSEIRKVLFAPVHPNADGSLSHIETDINKRTFEKLLTLSEQGHIKLTVRHLQSLERNGLWQVPGVKYITGKADQSTTDIDSADIVIARQTMQYLAVALGVPTVGMGEDIAPPMGSMGRGNFKQVRSWDKYKNIMAFPLDILTHENTMELFRYAASSEMFIADWRERMIGETFEPAQFVELVEKYL